MILTTAQKATIKADIAANVDMNTQPISNAGHQVITDLYNATAAGPFPVWNSATSIIQIKGAVLWANLTPAMAPDGTTLWANKATQCRIKQASIDILVRADGQLTIDATQAGIRAGFMDALTAVPSKSDGTNQPAGWTAVAPILQRNATRLEKLLAGSSATTGAFTANLPIFEGMVTRDQIAEIREAP